MYVTSNKYQQCARYLTSNSNVRDIWQQTRGHADGLKKCLQGPSQNAESDEDFNCTGPKCIILALKKCNVYPTFCREYDPKGRV